MRKPEMEPRGWRLTADDVAAWIDRLIGEGRQVIAPVEGHGPRVFRPLASAAEACLAPGKTRWSPKEFLFPRTETLYGFRLRPEGPELHDPPLAEREQVLFGVRSCDAAGLVRLDDVFLEGRVVDPLYARRRRLTTVVAFACQEAGPGCFCTAVGGSPMGTDGVDVLVLSFGADWLVRAVTDRGRALVSESWTRAHAGQWSLAADQVRQVEQRIARAPVAGDVAAVLESRFEHPAWQETARRCLSCSICAYVCPSCSCFDVHHEGDAWGGREIRCWDACTFPLFTRHASGHNPRATPDARYRQRALHKFAYLLPGEDGTTRCVGCGRCIALCPAGIDIHDTVTRIAADAEGEGADA